MMKDALLPAGIQIHIVFILAGQGGGKVGLSQGLSTGGLQERGGATQLSKSVQVLTPPLPLDTAKENRPPPPPCRKQNRAIVWLWVLLSSPRH